MTDSQTVRATQASGTNLSGAVPEGTRLPPSGPLLVVREDPLVALRALQKVAVTLSAELSIETLLRRILRAALDATQASAGSLLLHDAVSGQLRFEVAEGDGGKNLEGQRIDSRNGIAGWVFSQGEPLLIEDVRCDERFRADIHRQTGYRTASLLAVPLVVSGKKVGVLEVLNKQSGMPFTAGDADVLVIVAAQSAVAIENARLYQHLWTERDRIMTVEEEVRRELARDIHDGPAQLLSALVMNVRFARVLMDENAAEMAKQELASLEDLASRALKQLRGLLFSQRPIILETQGLFAALESYVKRAAESGDIAPSLHIECEPVRLTGKGDTTVFSIVQEAITNIKKHAHGARAVIRLSRSESDLHVRISDNGPGFNLRSVTAGYDRQGSFGLLNMSERAEQIGGTLNIESAAGKGTVVTLTVPLAGKHARA